MQVYYEELRDYLRRKDVGTFESLKSKLNIASDEEMMQLLISYMHDEIESMNFNSAYNRNKNLKKVIFYIGYTPTKLSINDHAYKMVYRDLEEISGLIDYKLENPGRVYHPNDFSKNSSLLINIQEKIKGINKKLNDKGLSDVTRSKEMYNFVDDVLNNTDSYEFVESLLNKYPSIVNIEIEGKTLIENVFERFIKSFNEETLYYDKLFYEKVINLFMTTPSFVIEAHDLKVKYLKKINCIKKKLVDNSLEHIEELCLLNEVEELLDVTHKKQEQAKEMIERLMVKHKLTSLFNEDEELELSMLIKPDIKDYVDHRDLNVITIDDSATRHFEDAIYLEELSDGYLFRLYSSDASAYIIPNFYLEKRAYSNAQSYFLPHYVIDDLLSFNKNTDRCAVCHEILLDKDFMVIEANAYRALINVKNNYDYNEAKNKILQNDPDMENLYAFTYNLRQKRVKQDIKKKEDILVNKKKCNKEVVGNMVKFATLFVNYTFIEEYNLPFICRKRSFLENVISTKIDSHFHEKSRRDSLNSVLKDTKRKAIYYGNFDSSGYADFCSPIRKSDSLWNQRVLLDKDNPEAIEEYKNNLDYVCGLINDKTNRNNDYEEEVKNIKKKVLKKVDKATNKY